MFSTKTKNYVPTNGIYWADLDVDDDEFEFEFNKISIDAGSVSTSATVSTDATYDKITPREPCRHFERLGRCDYGDNCNFAHIDKNAHTPDSAYCRYFGSRGGCKNGISCPLLHINWNISRRLWLAKQPVCAFNIKGMCKRGKDCDFNHE